MSNTKPVPPSLFSRLEQAFRLSWLVLSSLPSEASGDPDHPGWRDTLEQARPQVDEFVRVVHEARQGEGMAPDAERRIQTAEDLIRELVDRLHQRDSRRLPGLLMTDCMTCRSELRTLSLTSASTEAAAEVLDLVEHRPETVPLATTKKRTPRNGSRAKVIAVLTKHHQYAAGSVLNPAPLESGEIAKAAAVAESSVSRFFKSQFGEDLGATGYTTFCRAPGKLGAWLASLNGELTPRRMNDLTANTCTTCDETD